MTFVQIGNTLGISKNAARQHYQNALRRIREYEAYNRMIDHNNQPVDFPLTRGELKLIYIGLNELTKINHIELWQMSVQTGRKKEATNALLSMT